MGGVLGKIGWHFCLFFLFYNVKENVCTEIFKEWVSGVESFGFFFSFSVLLECDCWWHAAEKNVFLNYRAYYKQLINCIFSWPKTLFCSSRVFCSLVSDLKTNMLKLNYQLSDWHQSIYIYITNIMYVRLSLFFLTLFNLWMLNMSSLTITSSPYIL